ncbi:MAG: dephospho-CoA kinase [Candidatus Dormibacteria bacterium]
MRVIGLTGGIASGKSTVAAMLAEHGAVVVDADRLAREVVAPGQPALAEVVATFGGQVLQPDGALDRTALGRLVFADDAARRRLEAITHPPVRTLMAQRVAEAVTCSGAPLVVADIPLLFEGGRGHEFSGVLLVAATEATQLRRLQERDGLDDAAARQRLAAQLPMEEKRRRATWVIDNDAALPATRAALDRWWTATVEDG